VWPHAEDLAGNDDRDGGDQTTSVDDRTDAGEGTDRASNAPLAPEPFLDDAAQIAVV